jgi:hypothetical protein
MLCNVSLNKEDVADCGNRCELTAMAIPFSFGFLSDFKVDCLVETRCCNSMAGFEFQIFTCRRMCC